jgi:hypothetical protein
MLERARSKGASGRYDHPAGSPYPRRARRVRPLDGHTDPAEIAAEVLVHLRGLLADERSAEALRRVLDMEDQLLTVADIQRLTGFGRTKVDRLVQLRAIPMFRMPTDDGEPKGDWRITRRAFREAAARGFAVPKGRVMTTSRKKA